MLERLDYNRKKWAVAGNGNLANLAQRLHDNIRSEQCIAKVKAENAELKSDLAKVKAENADLHAVLFAGVACDDDTLVSRSQGSQECKDADATQVAKLKAVAKFIKTDDDDSLAIGSQGSQATGSRSQGSQECNTLVTGAEDADITLVAKLKEVAKVIKIDDNDSLATGLQGSQATGSQGSQWVKSDRWIWG